MDYNDASFIKAFNSDSSFTSVAWSLYNNRPIQKLHYGHLKCTLKPGDEQDFIYTVLTHFGGNDYKTRCFKRPRGNDYENLLNKNDSAWKDIWRNTAAIILQDKGNYAKYFYRSLFWMYTVVGGNEFPASEVQFANLTSPMAESYGYYSDSVKLDVMNWQMHSFTYGTSGWAAFASTMLGNKNLSERILNVFYNPAALKWNANHMFPFGKAAVYNKMGDHVYNGEDVYLSHHNPNAWSYGHELDYEI